jgi:hypothetical protein
MNAKQLLGLFTEVTGRLENAHVRLDAAVFAAYGWPSDLADEAVLQNLLALNLESLILVKKDGSKRTER